jgi:DNA polymerase/3'-5' exonuclease PolX
MDTFLVLKDERMGSQRQGFGSSLIQVRKLMTLKTYKVVEYG